MSDVIDFDWLLSNDIPLIDVRAPCEFSLGALPFAINLPLLTDSERQLVGTCYKQQGKNTAIALGHQLINAEVKDNRVSSWMAFISENPSAVIYCFRGGLRSHIVQEWLGEQGYNIPLISGGYKSIRQYLMQEIEQASTKPLLLIAGNTGCGKTKLLANFRYSIDLEGLAHHRGSSFGRQIYPQSTQIDFELRLGITLLKKRLKGISTWLVEDENCCIGSNHLPPIWYKTMQSSPLVVIEEAFDTRLNRIKQEYIVQMQKQYEQMYGEEVGWQKYGEHLHQGLYAIRKRLGIERYTRLVDLLSEALSIQQTTSNDERHLAWLRLLLIEYYDPMYRYQLSKKQEKIIYKGSYQDVAAFLTRYFI